MRAWFYEKAGPASVMQMGELPDPEPGAGEVRVKVAWSMINPTDVKRRETGRGIDQFPLIVPNNDGSGVIDGVGAGVDRKRVGERVWIFGAQAGRPLGTAAAYCALPAHQAIRLPDNADLQGGACLGVPAVTAHCGLFCDGPLTGKTVLVSGAAGRVGHYGVLLARWGGAARVIGTAGSDEKLAHAKAIGADHALNYRDADLAGRILEITGGKGVDHVLDVAFDRTVQMAPRIVATNGVITNYANDGGRSTPTLPNFRDLMQKCITMRPFAIYSLPQARRDHAFRDITTCLAEGALTHKIAGPMPFEEMAAAHEAVAGPGVFGCLLVEVDGSLK